MTKGKALLAGLFVVPILAACSEGARRWENPAVAEDLWSNHREECRRQASRQAEREYVTLDQPDPGVTFGRATTLRSDFARFDASKRREDLFVNCMRDRGYRRVRDEASEPSRGTIE